MNAERQGLVERLLIATRVCLTVGLALVAVLLINWLAARPDLRVRMDWTATGQNTVGEASASVLERLPGTVTLDVFFRPEEPPLTQVAYIAQERTRRLMRTLRDASFDRVDLRENDVRDVEAIEQRLAELHLRGFENCVVVSFGDQREVVSLNGGLAVFDPGAPPPQSRPAQIVEFAAERALISAMLKVTRGAAREVYFVVGHGEREVDDTSSSGLSELDRQLAQDGLGVSRWNPLTDGPIPEDCACLALIGATDALSDELLDSIEIWVRAGGRLVLVPHPEDTVLATSRVGELSARFGIEIQEGIVCQPVVDPQTGR
ncbi:MAG: Gldg family protein, partial [Planctomycetota bacterium]|nr:Gldg family protein [Planctomycetota bacterium]